MAHKKPCAKYQYVVTPTGPKILPVDDPSGKDEESPADYNAGGYLPIKVNDPFKNNRYRVVRKLGWGHFSTVWLVKDAQQGYSALKVVKSAGRYAETARDEIKLLSRVQSFSPNHPGRSHIVSYLDSFTHQGMESSHICIVFEPLGENLLALIERHKKGVPRALVRSIVKQILLGLEYLHDECDLVHTDIKPENILISIPDIENHIQNELSQSPSPTSRRVGVPFPTKTRSGMTIPHLQQRTRRQVQIFDSQPLASPSRNLRRTGYSSLSLRGCPSGVPSESSVGGSYGAPRQLMNTFTHASIDTSSILPKAPSILSVSAPTDKSLREAEVGGAGKGQITPLLPQSKIGTQSPPSTSSSLSSIVSIAASTNPSSNISTPPTSSYQSLTTGTGVLHSYPGGINRNSELCKSTKLPDPKGKARAGIETELASSCANGGVRTKAKSVILQSSNELSVAQKNGNRRSGHSQSRSGASTSGFWKDPGVAAPAPAVVVSAVVGAAGADGDCLQLSNTSIQLIEDGPMSNLTGTSEDSSATTAGVHLSSQKKSSMKLKTTSFINVFHKNITKHGHALDMVKPTHPSCPSLLTQTAPFRCSAACNFGKLHLRPARHRKPSFPSSNTYKHRSSSCKCTDPEHKHRSVIEERPKNCTQRDSGDVRQKTIIPHSWQDLHSSVPSITPTPALPCPSTPPPTPCGGRVFAYGLPDIGSPNSVACEECKDGESIRESLLPAHIPPGPLPQISVKIADLGNATPSTKHFTDDIQTRQYRAPEAILGRSDWDARADIWSVACLAFELLTTEYLFDPQGQGELFTKDDDHMAQIIELMGDFPMEVKMGGRYSRELFDHAGALRYIRMLKFWPLKRVMTEKYLYNEAESTALCEFLEPMLAVDMRRRSHARDMKNHRWLEPCEADETVTDW
ncbi:hypothetical protein AX15_005718 [Amanita polypyramis BW_CC]|nr:hypothetical protein AX15_005718 [Amanita polypyramis BW_CC]